MRHKRKTNKTIGKLLAWSLSALLLLTALTGCGKKQENQPEETNPDSGGDPAKESVWVPEYVSLSGDGIGYGNLRVDGDTLYFVEEYRDEETGAGRQSIATIALSDNARGQAIAPEGWGTDPETGALRKCETFFRTSDGNFVALEGVYPKGSEEFDASGRIIGPAEYYLCRYDADGQKLDERDLTDKMASEGKTGLLQGAAMDGDGRFYFAMQDGTVHLADAEGNYSGVILPGGEDNWIPCICAGKDGKVYIAQYEHNANSGEYVIKELDFEAKDVAAVCRNYPGSSTRIGMAAGSDQELLLYDGTTLYGYDTQKQTAEKLLDWMDSNVTGDNVICVHAMQDGRVLAIQRELGTMDMEMAFLSPKKSSEVIEKETITIACYQREHFLERVIARFNKQSDRYHVEVKRYFNEGITQEQVQDEYRDATLRFNADLVSDHAPDLIVLQSHSFDVDQLAKNGMFEDLNPWLEASEKYSREDFFHAVLEACTYGGKLVAIPKGFSISTLVGKASDLGEEPGWTMEEMIAFADAHPDALPLERDKRGTFTALAFGGGLESYADWESGECHFDSEEFIRILEFVDRFPADYSSDSRLSEGGAPAYRLQDGSILLYTGVASDLFGVQDCEKFFSGEKVNYIGYPNNKGNSGVSLTADKQIAMFAGSEHKEAAWAFLEYYIGSGDEYGDSTLYSEKKRLEASIKDVLAGNFPSASGRFQDGYGNLYLKETWINNWEYEYHIPTQEEIDKLMDLIESAVPKKSANYHILDIVEEELEPFFLGQKSARDVAKIIQNRVQLYMNENQ